MESWLVKESIKKYLQHCHNYNNHEENKENYDDDNNNNQLLVLKKRKKNSMNYIANFTKKIII